MTNETQQQYNINKLQIQQCTNTNISNSEAGASPTTK